MDSMEYYLKNHQEYYHKEALKQYKERSREDTFYKKLMKEILEWDEKIYQIYTTSDLLLYTSYITNYRNELGYPSDMDIYTDTFYSIQQNGYYNNYPIYNKCHLCLTEKIKKLLINYSYDLFRKMNQNEYQIRRAMFKFVLLVNMYQHHMENIKQIKEDEDKIKSRLTNTKGKKKDKDLKDRLIKNIDKVITTLGGMDYVKEMANNPAFQYLLVMRDYPEQYIAGYYSDKYKFYSSYISEYLTMIKAPKRNVDGFISNL